MEQSMTQATLIHERFDPRFTATLTLILTTLLPMVDCSNQEKNNGSEKMLFQELFLNYDSIHRPVSDSNKSVLVDFGISFNQLLDLDEKKQVMTSSVWIQEGWLDEALRWDPGEHNGLETLIVSSTHLWLPDIFIFNSGGGELDGFVNVTGSKLMIKHNGYVLWKIPLVIKSACAVDVTYFPYDRQHCEIHFGSWIYDISKLDLRCSPSQPNLDEFIHNNEFDIQDYGLYKTVVNESCCPGNGKHAMVNFYIQLKRKSIYYDYIVISPTLNLCILTLVTFMLPCHHGDKIAIGLTVFLTLYVLQLLIAENVPDTNTTPILGIFIFLVMTLNCLSLILATMVMSIKKKANLKPVPEVPRLVLWFCMTYLSRITCTSVTSRLYEYDVCSAGDESNLCSDKVKNNDNDDEDNIKEEIGVRLFEAYESDDSDFETQENGDVFDCKPQQNGHINALSELIKQTHFSNTLDHENTPTMSEDADGHVTSRKGIRKRASYKRAIYKNPVYDFRHTTTSSAVVTKRKSYDREVSITKQDNRRKRQWCFVAETIDKSSFLVYTLSMFVTIFTILVLVPNLQ